MAAPLGFRIAGIMGPTQHTEAGQAAAAKIIVDERPRGEVCSQPGTKALFRQDGLGGGVGTLREAVAGQVESRGGAS